MFTKEVVVACGCDLTTLDYIGAGSLILFMLAASGVMVMLGVMIVRESWRHGGL